MKYRKDIHEFVIKELPNSSFLKPKSCRIYEHEGFLYKSLTEYGSSFITSYRGYTYLLGKPEYYKIVEDKFKVKFANKNDILCRCGLGDSFSAFYGEYELNLKCKCGNTFTAYSG